jgi:hypothetical protein
MEEFRNRLEIVGGGTEQQNVILGIIGRKGTGKSSLTREILERSDREFIFDTAGDHLWTPDRFDQLDEAFSYVVAHGAEPGSFRGSYIPESDEDEDLVKDLSEISKAVWEVGNMTFVVEELPMMSQPNWAPAKFNKIVRLGRHRSINVVYTGQRAAELPRRVTGATDVFVLFQTSEPPDLDQIALRCGKDTAELVKNLGEHEFVVFDVPSRSLLRIDSEWYDLVLKPTVHYTPAIGGRSGRSALWSLDDGE